MKNLRLLLAATTAGAVLITVVAGVVMGAVWAIVVGTIAILATVVLSTYVLIKSNQTTLQRLSGAQKQNERILASLWSLQQKAENQRWVLSQQTAQLGSILNQLAEPDDDPQALTDLRRQVERILGLIEDQHSEKVRRQQIDFGRELDSLFADDPDVEITTNATESKNR
ncbi:MAG: hypothetical protein ACTIDO_07735 [Brevibacterium aurantiacum]|uniref:hypothetical protein n=1 Tax=Brevibacterium aurantiacum TaxID=273384 RepID=UPI003F91E1F6